MNSDPLVSIVTPSLNQGRFIRSAIESVLSQPYPGIEYLVVDGGSSDDTLDILRSYGDRVRWMSEADDGQSEAINKGFRLTQGSILTWLNADDTLAENAVAEVVKRFQQRPNVGLVYGQGLILDEHGDVLRSFAEIEPFSLWRLLYFLDYVLQPSAFFLRSCFDSVGCLDENLHYAMDWDLWIRLAAIADVHFVEQVLACSREYGETKTSTGGIGRCRELGRLARKHTGTFWTPGVKLYYLDTLHRQLRSRLPRLGKRLADRVVHSAMRRMSRDLPVYADGWLGPKGKIVLPRRWSSANLDLEVAGEPRGRKPAIRLQVPGCEHAVIAVDGPGIYSHEIAWDVGAGPFVEARVESSFSFRSRQDPRRLSVRLVGLQSGTSR